MIFRISLTPFLILILAISLTAGEIHLAIEQGDSTSVVSILEKQPGVLNACDSIGMTPLNLAAFKGHLNLVRELLARGADLRIGDKDSSQPVHYAAVAGQTRIIELLISKGADINAQDRNGETALLFALSYGKLETAKWLIGNGANVNLANLHLNTPLHWAALRDNIDLARLLLEHGADIEVRDSYGRTPLLLVARERGNAEMAEFLLDHGADVNAHDRFNDTPLSLAAWRGFQTLTDLFLDRGAILPSSIDDRKQMIVYCAERGLVNLFKKLVDSNIDISEKSGTGGTLLHMTAQGCSTELCAFLIDKGLNIEEKDRWGRTPLHYAAERGRTRVCSLLVARGAEVDAQTLAGHTPLSLALEFKEDTTVSLLRQLGAKIEKPNFPNLQGPYFGQKPPGNQLQLFAVDIVASSRFKHGSITFSPDGLEAYWSSEYTFNDVGYSVGGTLMSRVENGKWTVPKLAEYSTVGFNDDVPFFAPDGKRLYFLSRRPENPGGQPGAERIWYMDRTSTGFSQPHLIQGGPNDYNLHWQFSVAANGSIYFSSGDPRGLGKGDIWVSKQENDRWQPAEHLGAMVNSPNTEMCPFIAPDESYLIIVAIDESNMGMMCFKISFKKVDGTWTVPVNMGSDENNPIIGNCPMVSSDGKYLFLQSFENDVMDIYWINATIIEFLRKKILP